MNAETWFAVRDRIAALEWALDVQDEDAASAQFTDDAVITVVAAGGEAIEWVSGGSGESAAAPYSRFRSRGVVVADRSAWTFTPIVDDHDGACIASHLDLCVSIIKGVGSTALRSVHVVTDELVERDGAWLIRRRTVDARPHRGGDLS